MKVLYTWHLVSNFKKKSPFFYKKNCISDKTLNQLEKNYNTYVYAKLFILLSIE